MSYTVVFMACAEEAWTYTPEGGSESCDEQEARERFAVLLYCGCNGISIDGLYVWHVAIRDEQRNIMLSQYVDDKEPAGPWAEQAVAA